MIHMNQCIDEWKKKQTQNLRSDDFQRFVLAYFAACWLAYHSFAD